MNFLKKLTGLFVFVAAVAGAVAVSRYFSAPRPAAEVEAPPPPAPPTVSVAPVQPSEPQIERAGPPASVALPPVRFKVRLVTLDFASKKTHLTLDLERDRSCPAPESVWAWAAFYSPEGGGWCVADAVEVRRPFAHGHRASVVVEADASRCGPPRSPAATLYARVNVSPRSAEAAQLDLSQLDADLSKTIPVVVAGARTIKN